jgi:rhamnosyltransferase
MKNICSLITVYKPNIGGLLYNITVMLQYSDTVYLLFNSPVIEGLQFDKRIICIDNKQNIGLSKAINKGIKRAVDDGYTYAILFDQDSCLTKENFIMLFDKFEKTERTQKVMCVGPSLNVRNNLIPIPEWSKTGRFMNEDGVYAVRNIITSGMLVNTARFIEIGGFDERFPVDFCDFIFCWRAVYNGYAVLQSAGIYIIHEIGTGNVIIRGRTVHFHAPYRNYFMVRDTLNICFRVKETPASIRFRYLFFLPFRMLLFLLLCDKKIIRMKMYFLGFKDFLLIRYGFGSIANILNAK